MYCNTQHFAGTLPIISISRGHFTLTDIKGTDMEAGRDPDLVKIQNCSEHTQSSWNQIRSWEKPACEAVSKLKSGLLSEDWSSNRGVSDRVNTRKIQILGKFKSSRWCHDLSVVCWLLTSLRSAVSPWEGGRRNTLDGKQPLPAFHIFAAGEWILFARKQSSSLKSGAKYPKTQTPSSKCAFLVKFRI